MEDKFLLICIIAISGIISTIIGGIIGASIKIKTKKQIAILFELTAGIMTSIICIELLPSSFMHSGVFASIISVFIGLVFTFFVDTKVKKYTDKNNIKNHYLSLALLMFISMCFDNMSEGMAVSGSFLISAELGLSVIIAISIHNIPEGMSVAISMSVAKMKFMSIFVVSLIVGVFLGIGGIIGISFGSISQFTMGLCLCFSAGVMLYIISCDLLSKSRKMYGEKTSEFMYILGILIGAIISLV